MPRDARPWLAVLLSFLQPGLGHVYLQDWLRGLGWFGVWVGTILVVAPLPDNPGIGDLAEYLLGSSAMENLSPGSMFALMAIVGICTYDAYRRAQPPEPTHSASDDHRVTCPNCGKEVDPELDFCYWCSTEFEKSRT